MAASRRSATALGVVLGTVLTLSPPGSDAAVVRDPLRRYQWGLEMIQAPRAWGLSRGEGVIVGVIDSGVRFWHPDLAGQVLALRGDRTICVPSRGGCDRADVSDVERSHHGTPIASIIAAKVNPIGMAGVAPGAKIVSAYLWDDTSLESDFKWVIERGAEVINFSAGWHGPLAPEPGTWTGDPLDMVDLQAYLRGAIDYATSKGVLIVAAAGNEFFPACNYPASEPRVLCVGAVSHLGTLAPYSNFGVGLDVVAPGGSMYSVGSCDDGGSTDEAEALAFRIGILAADSNFNGTVCGSLGYTSVYGTSFAVPHVAGVAALLVAQGLNRVQIMQCIRTTADDLGAPGYDPVYGYGLVNAYRAVSTCPQRYGLRTR